MSSAAPGAGLHASALRMRVAYDRKAVAFAERAIDDVVAMTGCLDRLSAPPRDRNPAFSHLYATLTAVRRNADMCGFCLVAELCALCRDMLDAAPDDRSAGDRSAVADQVRLCLDEMRRLLELCVDGTGGPVGEALLARLRTGDA